MARRKKKEKTPAVEWERDELIEKSIRELIAEANQNHLESAKIFALRKPGKASGGPCGRIVKVKVVSKAIRALIRTDMGEANYLVEVRSLEWDKLQPDEKKRELFHTICHMAGRDEKDRWTLDDHDVEEHSAVVQRFGQYSPSIQGFVKVAKQLPLPGAK